MDRSKLIVQRNGRVYFRADPVLCVGTVMDRDSGWAWQGACRRGMCSWRGARVGRRHEALSALLEHWAEVEARG